MGDLVLIPLRSTDSKFVAMGRVTGKYEYRELTKDVRHVRQVEWLKKDVPVSDFLDSDIQPFQIHLTVYGIKRDNILNSIKKVLLKYGISDTFDLGGIQTPLTKTGTMLTINDLAMQTYLSIQELSEIDELLNEKRQIIFYGPPGTSKTYVAKKFSEYFARDIDNVEIVQFHQSYSYEDFVEGIKPNLSNRTSNGILLKKAGMFKKLAKKCIDNPDKNFVAYR